MKKSAQQLIDEYYEIEKHNYPNISKEEFNKICRAPFNYIKNEIEGEELPEIGIKHLGTFSVKMGTAKFSIKNLEVVFQKGNISLFRYTKLKKILSNYLKRRGEIVEDYE